jgi:hypothetical protein
MGLISIFKRIPISNALKYVIFGYCMNKLWIFEVLIVASAKVCEYVVQKL